ncbi:MAG: addiction module protein [Syntrophobacteraceae bacterium]|nr:addiction module protein [Syntrophobacteraceae bacterium]
MESVSQLAKKAIEFEPVERIQLVEAILRSLDKPDDDIEQNWVAESEARYAAYRRGEIASADWEEIKKKYKR